MNIYSNTYSIRLGALKKCLLALLLLNVLPASADYVEGLGNKKVSKYDYAMRINRATMAKVDGNMVVSLNLTALQDIPAMQSIILSPEITDSATMRVFELPLIFINSRNQQIYFERDLKSEYPDAMAVRKKNGQNLNINYLRTVKYEPWMDNAVLKVRKLSCACNRQKERGEEIAFVNKKPAVVKLYPVYVQPPVDGRVKVREEKGSAYINFVVDKWDIRPDYMNNPVELQKIHNSVNIVKNDSNVTIQKMVIEGYASPEGNNPHNEMLSRNRTEALRQYLINTGRTYGIRIEAAGKGENWDGFMKYLRENTYFPQRDRIYQIATSSMGLDERERAMKREAPDGWRHVLRNAFPSLRCTNYVVQYVVRPFTVEESEQVFETRPTNLNLNEIFKLADKYATNQEKYYAIMRKAYMLYSDDSYINLTLAYLALQKKNADEAIEYLKKVDECPEKWLNEGIAAYLKGDTNTAFSKVEQAKARGLEQATKQYQEFMKLK